MERTQVTVARRMTVSIFLWLAAAAAPLGWTACGPADEGQGPGAEAPEPNRAADGAGGKAGALEAELWLDDLRLGREVGPDGAVAPAQETDEFKVGESVYVSMAISDAPADAGVHVVYESAAGETVAEDAKKVPAEARYLYFDSGDTTDWQPGEYRVVVAVEGQTVSELELTLMDR